MTQLHNQMVGPTCGIQGAGDKNMKVSALACLALVLTSISAAAATSSEEIKLTCVTDYPSTSFVIRQEGGRLLGRVIHHNGLAYMPIHSGIITPSDLKIMSERAATLTQLEPDMEFSWPLEKCVRHDDHRFECFGTDDRREINGKQVVPFALFTSRINHDNIAGQYEDIMVTLTFSIDGKSYATDMNYPVRNCWRDQEQGLAALRAFPAPKR